MCAAVPARACWFSGSSVKDGSRASTSAPVGAQARSVHPDVTWVRADARALAFAEDFDLAVTFGALGHFLPPERPALFEGVYRALRPGGLVHLPDRRAAAPHLALALGHARIRPGHASPQCRVAPAVRHVLPHQPAARDPHRPDGGWLHRAGRRLDRPGPAPGTAAHDAGSFWRVSRQTPTDARECHPRASLFCERRPLELRCGRRHRWSRGYPFSGLGVL
jgi:SAM-dependent methyltransferase